MQAEPLTAGEQEIIDDMHADGRRAQRVAERFTVEMRQQGLNQCRGVGMVAAQLPGPGPRLWIARLRQLQGALAHGGRQMRFTQRGGPGGHLIQQRLLHRAEVF
ncbi:hypothetical protein D3C77_599760 [compost metagenome]